MGGKGSGAKRKPTAFHILHGSFKINPSRENKHEPEAPKDAPRCPAHLDAVGKAEWKFICGKLADMKLLTSADRPLIEQYCQLYSQYRAATKVIREQGQTMDIVGEFSTAVVVHPMFKVQQQLVAAMGKVLAQFGFSPSARAGLFVERGQAQESGGNVARRKRG